MQAHVLIGTGIIMLIIGLIVGLIIYFVPSFIAFSRRHPQRGWILLLNIVVGWTFFGWVGALVWSVIMPERPFDPRSAPANTKICPRCAYQVKREAFACHFCGYEFGASPPSPPPRF